ncbi:MAG: hypothetical protein QXV05_00340 [Candidatus Korarchaeum sp.]
MRDKLTEDWGYSKHYVDSAIREAYGILKSGKGTIGRGEERRSQL